MAAITPVWTKTHYEGNGRRRIEARFEDVDNGDTWAHGIPDGKLTEVSGAPYGALDDRAYNTASGTVTFLTSINGGDVTLSLWGSL